MNPSIGTTITRRTRRIQLSALPLVLFLSLSGGHDAGAQTKRPLKLADMFAIERLSDAQLSPDGRWVLYTQTHVLLEENKTNADVWVVPAAGGDAKALFTGPKHDRDARWSPDGSKIAFTSTRSGTQQIYIGSLSGGEAKPLTSISTGAAQPVWSPDGKWIAFTSAVYPEFSERPYTEADRFNMEKDAWKDTAKVKARVMTELLYRHWDSWVEDKRTHIFIVPAVGGDPINMTPGDRDAVPTSTTFSAGDDFAWSPDGKEIAYTATPFPTKEEAWSTNHDIYTVNISTRERKQLTTNPAADAYPRYSAADPDYIAYRAQRKPGSEADRWEIMVLKRSTGATVSLTADLDRSIDNFEWSRDGATIYFETTDGAAHTIWSLDVASRKAKRLTGAAQATGLNVTPDGRTLVFTSSSLVRPAEVYSQPVSGGRMKQLTEANDALFSALAFTEPEEVWFEGAGGAKVQMWIVKPPMFNAAKKYPLVYLVHGGPQGVWGNSWSTRWNPSLWAAQGYVVALPNPRGSTGFGQKFTDEISHDWGGKVYDDLMAGLAYLEKLPYIDTTRKAAAGASYGGYMMNWMMGRTDKFNTYIVHCGVFNFYSMYGTTEETWFDEWEHGIPWETENFDRFSPHKNAKNFKTPTLIIHNELDYRVPLTEGQQLFTTLQRKGIPSKFVYFPDEGHWVLKPANSEFWHTQVFDWLKQYLKPEIPQ